MNPKNYFKCASCNCQSGVQNAAIASAIILKKNSKPGSQGQENDDKSTTRFEMEDKFVSIENEDQDHANTSLRTRMIMLMESRKDRLSKRQTEKLIFSCGVLTCIFIKKTDMHSYTINGSRTTYLCIFVQERYY